LKVLENKKTPKLPYRKIVVENDSIFTFELINRPHIAADYWDILNIETAGPFYESEMHEAMAFALKAAKDPSVKRSNEDGK